MAGDPHWDKVVLAMHMDGVGSSTVFTDLKGHAMAAAGTAQISTAQSRFGGASGKFGVSTGNRVLSEASNDFSMGAGPFTIDLFVNPSQFNANEGQIFSGGGGQFAFNGVSGLHYLFLITSNGIAVQYWTGVGGASIGGALSLNQFTHVEFSKDASGTIRLFINGVVAGSATDFVSPSGVPTVALGGYAGGGINGSNMFTGYLDDIRITKGVCRHTANFTPPEVAFSDYQSYLSGTVKDGTNTPCARTVRAYDRVTGLLSGSTVSDASTGVFTVTTQTVNPHTVIVLDDDAGTAYNALVFDNVVPV